MNYFSTPFTNSTIISSTSGEMVSSISKYSLGEPVWQFHSFFLFHLQSIKNAVTGFHQPLVVEESYDTQCDDSED